MAIVDGRTLLDNANAITNWGSYPADATNPNSDSDTLKFGTASVAFTADNTSGGEGIFFDDGADRDWTDDIVYMWVNIANPGLMETKANGGIRIRVANNAGLTNFVERNFEGSDTYSGGWKMFVIDMNDVFNQADATGGTPPVITAARYIGVVCDLITGAMPKMQDNIFIDSLWRLQKGVPGIRVESDNGGSPWTWDDIRDAGDEFDTTKAWGHVIENQGQIILFSSIEFGDAAGTTSTDFDDFTGAKIVFGEGSNPLPNDIYEITVVGNATGTCDIKFGSVVGSGADRQGLLGGSISTTGPLFTIDAETDIADVDTVNLYGISITGAGICQFSGSTKTDLISVVFTDCGEIQPNDSECINCFLIAPKDRGMEMLATNNIQGLTCIAGSDDVNITLLGSRTDYTNAAPGASTDTFTHTVTAGTDALVVVYGGEGTVNVSIDLDGNPFQEIIQGQIGGVITTGMFVLFNPPVVTSGTITISYGSTPLNLGASAFNLDNVSNIVPVNDSARVGTDVGTNPASGTTISHEVPMADANSYVIGFIYDNDSTVTYAVTGGADQTEVVETAIGSEAKIVVGTLEVGVSGDISWDTTGAMTGSFGLIAVEFLPSSAEHHIHHNNVGDASITYTNMEFFGFGAAGGPKWHGENSQSGADIDISATGTSDPTANEFENTGEPIFGTVVVTNNTQVTFDKMKDNSEVRVFNNSTGVEIAGIENATAGSPEDRNFAWTAAAALTVDYVIHNFLGTDDENFETIRVNGFIVPNDDVTIDIQQRLDRNVE